MKKQKKIGILTFSHTKNMNFGASLQSYALYTTFERMGFVPYIIDWKIKKKFTFSLKSINRDSSRYDYIKAVIRRIVGVSFAPLLNFISRKLGESPFIEFSEKYLPNKSIRVTKKSFSELNKFFETFVVGSDQVWRYKSSLDIKTFFFDFVDDKNAKIAYAASFGIDKWSEAPDDITREVSHLIARFKSISVREDKGVDICSSTFGINATHVLDPTLLLTQSDYAQIIKEGSYLDVVKSDFIATMLLDNVSNDDFNEKLSNITQRSTVNIKGVDLKVIGRQFVKYNTVPHWLEMIQTAHFIVTDSFHCAVFCLLFEKPFAVIINKDRGISRLESFLSLFNISNVLFRSKEEFLNSNIWLSKINYDVINKKLKEERIKSMQFLTKALSDE